MSTLTEQEYFAFIAACEEIEDDEYPVEDYGYTDYIGLINQKLIKLEALRVKVKQKGYVSSSGICRHIDDFILVKAVVTVWPSDYKYFSGDTTYPVQPPEGYVESGCREAQRAYHSSTTFKESWSGPYGERRLVLVDLVINKLKLVLDFYKEMGL